MTKEEKIMLRELYSSANADQRLILEKICPELKEDEDERIRKALIDFFGKSAENGEQTNGVYDKDILAWLEKQGRQEEPQVYETEDGEIITYSETDGYKVAAKFHEGDWVVRGDTIAQILDIQEQYYVGLDTDGKDFTSSRYLSDDKIHLWTINDAKDGDVLATKYGVFIYAKVLYDKPYAYCGVDKFGVFKDNCLNNNWTNSVDNIHPATKEQRDLLFKKMEEAGYKWENNQLEEINGDKNFVDLGLPSGTLWAKCNLGAEKETDFGKFYQWGDTQGYEGVDEHQFNWDDYKWGTSSSCLSKYNNTDGKLVLDNEDDPIFVASNGEFKMPTKEQWQELIDHTYHEQASIDDVVGMKFFNKKDSTKYIFIPATGYWWDGSLFGAGSWGLVWSASRNGSNVDDAWNMSFGADGAYMSNFGRCIGCSVRGVLNK